MNDSGKSQKEAHGLKIEVLSIKTKSRIGFRDVRSWYETGSLAQVTAEMRSYNLHIPGFCVSKKTKYGRYCVSTG